MDLWAQVVAWLQTNAVYLAVLLGISESLALVPALKANGILQAVINALKWLKGLFASQPPALK